MYSCPRRTPGLTPLYPPQCVPFTRPVGPTHRHGICLSHPEPRYVTQSYPGQNTVFVSPDTLSSGRRAVVEQSTSFCSRFPTGPWVRSLICRTLVFHRPSIRVVDCGVTFYRVTYPKLPPYLLFRKSAKRVFSTGTGIVTKEIDVTDIYPGVKLFGWLIITHF